MFTSQDIAHIAFIGIGATALMDAWLLTLARLGFKSSSFALMGRWIGHMPRGRFAHVDIAQARPIPAELALGWLTHYVIGIAYGALLVALLGSVWLRQPTLIPALVFGAATVIAPLFVMQPAMGAGFAASKTPTPLKNCLRSTANHVVFGAGLYLAAVFIEWISR
jgi:hypothetical protein